jgi:hypothetical protein
VETASQKARLSLPLCPLQATAIYLVHYKFISATPGISLKGLLNLNWNEGVKTLSSFLEDKAMHLSGLGASPNPGHHINSLIPKYKCLETILLKYKQF